jgi:hypothetical protein
VSNVFYNPSGNPATGAEGLSALIRAEFAAIGTAFNMIPQISTTGSYATIFNQVGNYTYTLPAAPGTLATQADVASEATRAFAAEAVLTAAVSAETTARLASVGAEVTRAETAEALLAPIASPTFTGTVVAPLVTLAGGTVNGTAIGSTTPSTGAFTALSASGAVSGSGFSTYLASPPAIGGTTPGSGAFTTLTASGTVSGAGFTSWAASPPAIGGAAAAAGAFTALNATSGNVLNTVGRNLIHNGLFRVQQRGQGAWTAVGYTADRWLCALSGSTCSTTIIALADTDRAAIGDEAATYALQLVVGGTSGAGDYVTLAQRIEGVRRISGKTVTLSFWARAATSGAPKIGNDLTQCFGTGGSPSANVASIGSSAVTISTVWTRYTITVAVPSASGKTFGATLNTDWIQAAFWLSAGSTLNAEAGSIGVQSATFQLWGIQLEVGSVTTQLEKPDLATEMANCQRFYETGQFSLNGYTASGCGVAYTQSFQVAKRATPTMAASGAGANVSGTALSTPTVNGFTPYGVGVAAGSYYYAGTFTASADL